ncbi:ESF1 homolog [Tubulanus polymorphus]|uniref:ESF1 homolog n=1 Tax=Tubulanus polymorphus TaxID=672921 RepID=UPI003DA661E8
MDHVSKDARFAKIAKDPRFHRMARKDRKVKIDKRFKSMFDDKRFKLKYTVDKRGRPVHTTTNSNLQKFYDLSDSESDEEIEKSDDEDEAKNKCDNLSKNDVGKTKKQIESTQITSSKDVVSLLGTGESTGSSKFVDQEEVEVDQSSSADELQSDEEESDDEEHDETAKIPGPDLARGEGPQSSSDEEDEFEYDNEDKFDHKWGEVGMDAPQVEDATCRLAVCNMDWDRIKAQDIMVLLNSFKPTDGIIKSVTIYPSDFGLERMKEEQLRGPIELTEEKLDDGAVDNEEESTEGHIYHREKLRQYQLNRLKYYYAVVECDSVKTAEHIYSDCDGYEYEASATKLDLRFIPDDMTFENERTSRVEDMPDFTSYKPSVFITSALNQSKVNLTWDETNHDRLAITMKKKFTDTELNDANLNDYLASSSDEEGLEEPGDVAEDMDEENQIQKYKDLLKGLDGDKKKSEEDMEMEITWEPGLKGATETILKKKTDSKELTPWEEYLKKKREKKKQKRAEKKNEIKGTSDETTEDIAAFSDDDIPSDIDINDPYFKEELGENVNKKKGSNKKTKKGEKARDVEDESVQPELNLLTMDEDDNREHFNLKDILKNEKKNKKKKKKLAAIEATKQIKDTFKVNVNDKRFNAMYTSHLFNIDPSSHEYKKTKAMDDIVKEKLKRREITSKRTSSSSPCNEVASKKKKLSIEPLHTDNLDSLVKSVKMKTQRFKKKK